MVMAGLEAGMAEWMNKNCYIDIALYVSYMPHLLQLQFFE